jgi:triosephosphate isomerase (TIM)
MHPHRVPLIAGNWKLHHGGSSGVELAVAVARAAAPLSGVEVVVAPPFTVLAAVARECAEVARQYGGRPIGVAGQDLYPEPEGAFTGEVSAPMLREAGCDWVIVGHSERRQFFGETDPMVANKTHAALGGELFPIACIGETLEERSAGRTLEVVLRQLDAVMDALASAPGRGVVAYEPVWAIGTGQVATPEDAEAVHAAIRERLGARSSELGERTRVLYGGSVKPDNAGELLGQPNIDGALVGGASLSIADFGAILAAAQELST